ncbi:MAG: hypothetical protein V1813_04235 [Candidatus Aenigmatarchaeota archaeon]
MKMSRTKRNALDILIVSAILCIVVIWVFFWPGTTDNGQAASGQSSSAASSHRIVQANAMQQIYSDFYGPPSDGNGPEYFAYLADIGWNETSFFGVINNSMEVAGTKMAVLDSGRTQPVLFNIGVGEAQQPEYATTQLYRQNGQYGVVIWLHLERSPTVTTPAKFWGRDYAYPVGHEMRHVERLFASGIFDGYQAGGDLGSSVLYQEYLVKTLNERSVPAEFNSTQTAASLDELGVVLETDDPKEIALNIDRLNSFTLDILRNDESLGASTVVPLYLEQIVLARHLSDAYNKPSVQKANYSIRESAFDQMDAFSTAFRNELYAAYPDDVEAMQRLEAIYEEEARQALMKNTD